MLTELFSRVENGTFVVAMLYTHKKKQNKILNKKFLNPYLEIETASGHQLKPSSKNWMSKVIGRKLKVVNLRSKFVLKNLKLTNKNRKSKPKGEFLNRK